MSEGPFIAANVRMQFHTPDGKFTIQLEDDGDITVWESEIPAIGNRFEASVEEMDAIVNTYQTMRACMTETKGLVRAHEDKQRTYNHEVLAAEETTRLQEEAHKAAEAVGARLVYSDREIGKDYRKMGLSPVVEEPVGVYEEARSGPGFHVWPDVPLEDKDIPKFKAGLVLADAIKAYIDTSIADVVANALRRPINEL